MSNATSAVTVRVLSLGKNQKYQGAGSFVGHFVSEAEAKKALATMTLESTDKISIEAFVPEVPQTFAQWQTEQNAVKTTATAAHNEKVLADIKKVEGMKEVAADIRESLVATLRSSLKTVRTKKEKAAA